MHSGTAGERQVLRNILKDDCIHNDVTDEFFRRLTQNSTPRSCKEAWIIAIDVVKRDPDNFVCRGELIPKTLFSQLFRLEDVKALRRHLPDEHLKLFGIRDKNTFNPMDLSDDEINIILNEYQGMLKLGNLLHIVWVSAGEIAENFPLRELVNRLGLGNLERENRCIKIVIDHGKVSENLHLPRSFDGIDSAQFKVVEDCHAESGITLPLNFIAEQGLPEAVHRSCEVKPRIFSVESIE